LGKRERKMKKGIMISTLLFLIVIGYSLLTPAVMIDGAPYKIENITEGVKRLSEERDQFYRELDKSVKQEISDFISDQRSLLRNAVDPSVLTNGLKDIIQKKYGTARKQDALFESSLAGLMQTNKLRFAIPLLQIRMEKTYDELYTALFIPQFHSTSMNGSVFDETALTIAQEFCESNWNEFTASVLQKTRENVNRFGGQVLDNLANHKRLDEGVDIDEIVSIPGYYRNTVSQLNTYNASLLSQCSVPGQYDARIVSVNATFKRSVRGNSGGYDFDTVMFQALREIHNNVRAGFGEYYRSNTEAIITIQFDQMKKNLAEKKNVDQNIDIEAMARLYNYLCGQAKSYEAMAASIFERALRNPAGMSMPVIFDSEEAAPFRDFDLSPLAMQCIGVNSSLYQGEALLAIERETASLMDFFEAFKKENLEQEAQRIDRILTANIREYKDLHTGVGYAAYRSLVDYLFEQTAKSRNVVETLLNQCKAESVFPTAVSETQPLESFRSVINVNLPAVELEYFNGTPLDQKAAHIINATLAAARSEWKRVNTARKIDLLNRRQNQYQQNIEARRNINYGIKVSELTDAVEWEIRQQQISRELFASLIKSCTLNAEALPESRIVNQHVSIIDISPLAVSVKSFNGMFYDAVLVSGVENMADTLAPILVEQLRSETVNTAQRQMNILRRNSAEWAEYRYRLITRLALTAAEFKEWTKSTWAKIHSREYQEVNNEGAMYISCMIQDFRLYDELLYELRQAVESENEFFEALTRDFKDCALTGSGRWDVEGVTSEVRIHNAAYTVAKYINDVFPRLLNTQVEIKFLEKESMNWGPVLILQIAVGFIPGVGMLADLVFDVCIEGAACLVEKKLKQDEYTAKINELISVEEQNLLYIINKPVYGGLR
jgi:hypothetical protein